MKNIILILVFLTTSMTAAFAVDCKAQKRVLTGNGVQVLDGKLELVENATNYVKLETDLEEAYFSVEVLGDTVRSMITLGPDYMTGNLSKGSFDSDGNLKLSYVTPKVTYILTCHQ